MLIPGFPAQSSSAQTAIAQAAIALQADGHKGVVVKSGIGRGHWMCEIPNGSRIDVLEEVNDHYRVRFGDKEGWAKAKNFSIMASGSSGSTSPYSAQSPSPIAQTANALQKDGHKGVVVKSGIGRGKFICEIPNGTTLEVLEEKHGHYHVRFEGKEGWAKACNFSEVTTAIEEPVTTAIEDADDADKEKVTTAIEETVPLAIEDADGEAKRRRVMDSQEGEYNWEAGS